MRHDGVTGLGMQTNHTSKAGIRLCQLGLPIVICLGCCTLSIKLNNCLRTFGPLWFNVLLISTGNNQDKAKQRNTELDSETIAESFMDRRL